MAKPLHCNNTSPLSISADSKSLNRFTMGNMLSSGANAFSKVTKLNSMGRSLSDSMKGFGKFCSVAVMLLLAVAEIQAAGPYYSSSASTGNWAANATWSTVSCGSATAASAYPLAGDAVNITCSSHTITVASTAACGALTISGIGLTISSGQTLTCSSLNMTSGTLVINGTGQLIVTGTMTLTGGTVTGGGTIVYQGTAVPTLGASLAAVSFEYNSATTASVAAATYGPLIMATTGIATAAGTITCSSLNMTSGTLAMGAQNMTVNSTGTALTAGTITASTGVITFTVAGSAFTTVGTTVTTANFTIGSATATTATLPAGLTMGNLVLNTTGAITIGGALTTGNFTITALSGNTFTAAGAISCVNLSVASGKTLAMGANALSVSGTWSNSGTVTIGTATLTLSGSPTFSGGTFTPTTGTTITCTGTVAYNYSIATVLAALNVTSGTTTAGAAITVTNFTGGGTLAMGANALTIAGLCSLPSGSVTIGTATLTLNGTISRTTGTITVASGTSMVLGLTANPGDFGVFLSNTAPISMTALTVNASATFTTKSLTLSGNLVVANSANLIWNPGSTASLPWTITGGNIGANATLTLANTDATSHFVVNNPSFIVNGTIVFNAGQAANQMAVNGTFTDNQGSVHTNNNTVGQISFASGAVYNYVKNGATGNDPILASWNAASTFSMQGGTLLCAMPANNMSNQTFGNMVWNSAVQSCALSFVGNITCAGNFTITSTNSQTLALAGYTLTVGGNFANNLAAGSFDASAAGSKIAMNGATQTFNIGTLYTNSIVDNLNTSSSVSTTLSANNLNVNNLNIASGTFSIGSVTFSVGGSGSGTYTNSGTINASTGSSVLTLKMNNATSPNFTIGTYTSSLVNNLNITSGSTGVTLGSPVNATTLTMTSGLLNTTATYILTVKGTATTSVTGGSATCYVHGPLARTFGTSISAGTYTFPVGKGNYNEFDYVPSATTTAVGGPVIQVEVFDATAGGTDGLLFNSSPTPVRYWSASFISGSITTTGTSNVRLFDNNNGTLSASSAIGNSATQTGTYASLGGASVNTPSAGYLSTSSSAPNTLGFFKMGTKGCMSGIYTVGATGNFTTLTSAVAAYNGASSICGSVVFNLIDATYGSETYPIVVGPTASNPSNYTLTIKPNTTATVSGSYAGGLIKLSGSYIIIDGSNAGASDQSLTIKNTSAAASTAVVQYTGSTTYNTVKNCLIQNGATSGTSGLDYGIALTGASVGSGGADNDNATIQNNTITGAEIGIYAVGTASVSAGGLDNLNINSNTITTSVASTTASVTSIGIEAGNALNSKIYGNSVSVSITYTSNTTSPVGISLETGFVSSSVYQNKISNVTTAGTGGYGGRGMTIGTGTATSNLTIYNNLIYGVNGSNYSAFSNSSAIGILIGEVGGGTALNTTTGGVNLYYNTVSMTGTNGTGSSSAITAAIFIASGTTSGIPISGLDIRNNIFSNTLTSPATYTGQVNYGIFMQNIATGVFTTCDYNDFYAANSLAGTNSYPVYLGGNLTTPTSLGQNTHSIITNPLLTSATNLQIGAGSPAAATGTPITGITTDYMTAIRSSTAPSMGAYENVYDATPPTIVYTPLSGTCTTGARTLNATITDASGVPTTGSGLPMLYYSINGGAYTGVQATYSGSNVYSFSFGGSAVSTNLVQYYVVAQDAYPTPNVGSFPATGASGFTASAPAASTPPTTPSSYYVGSLSGAVTVGASGTYPTLSGAGGLFAAINNLGLSGNLTVTMLSSTTETGAVTLNAFTYPCGGGPFTVNITPDASVSSAITASGAPATANAPLISLNGVVGLTMDGRIGGTGTTSLWTIQNTATTSAGPAIQLTNGSNNNYFNYLTILSSNQTATSGTVALLCGSSGPGNSGDYIQNCNIGPNATTYPVNGICAYGYGSYANSSMHVLNNNIYNFLPGTTGIGSGVCVTGTSSPNTDFGDTWTISGNSIYNSVTQVNGYYVYPINFQPGTSSASNTISGNYIGGQSALCGGTGSPWVCKSTSSSGIGTPAFAGIYVYASAASITNNTISNIQINNTNQNGHAFGINIASGGSGGFTINGNTIGNPSPSGSAVGFQNTGAAANGGSICGIVNQTSGNITIGVAGSGNGNTIANLSNVGSSVNTPVAGIVTNNGVNSIVNNTIFNLSAATQNTVVQANSIPFDGSVVGICEASSITGQKNINNNTIYNLTGSGTAAAATRVVGINSYIAPLALPLAHSCNANLIYNLDAPNTNTSVIIAGIRLSGSSSSSAVNYAITNNMVQLGYRGNGTTITGSANLIGIFDNSSGYSGDPVLYDNNIQVWHNSVYVGGTGVTGGTVNTYGFYRNNTNGSPKNVESIFNNIFVNNRSYSVSGTGFNVGIGLDNNLTYSPNFLTTDYNIVYGTGTQYRFGYIGSTSYAAKANWIAANATFDTHSIEGDPKFNAPTAATPDLHLSASSATPAESAGTATYTITNDFDGQTRASYTPVDIGADCGNFIGLPIIVYTPLAGTASTANRPLTSVSITSSYYGINVTTGTKPRLYYKNTADANNVINGNTSATTGWKYVESNGTTTPFDFTIDYTLLNTGTPTVGQTIQYFVIAQDNASTPNVAINAGTFAATPASVALATANLPTGTLNSYKILTGVQATYYVGPAGTGSCSTPNFSTFTTASTGFFASVINNCDGVNNVMNQNVTVYVTGNITETGATAINQWVEDGNGPYTLTIVPCDATLKTITASVTGPVFNFNGADRVTFDGRYNATGSTSYFTIQNTKTANGTNAVFDYYNDAQNNTLKYCTLLCNNNGNTSGVVEYMNAATGGSGNSGNTIDHCNISFYTANRLSTGIYSSNATSGVTNSTMSKGNTITNNNIYDIHTNGANSIGIYITPTGNGPNWNISSNNFYSPTGSSYGVNEYPIFFAPSTTSYSNTISYNLIGGNAAPVAGVIQGTWTNLCTYGYATYLNPITVSVGGGKLCGQHGYKLQSDKKYNRRLHFRCSGSFCWYIHS